MSQLTPAGRALATRSTPDVTDTRHCKSFTLSVAALSLTLFSLSACNTFGGAGQDIENAGDAIADTNESTSD